MGKRRIATIHVPPSPPRRDAYDEYLRKHGPAQEWSPYYQNVKRPQPSEEHWPGTPRRPQ
jgi:hypothetical protein